MSRRLADRAASARSDVEAAQSVEQRARTASRLAALSRRASCAGPLRRTQLKIRQRLVAVLLSGPDVAESGSNLFERLVELKPAKKCRDGNPMLAEGGCVFDDVAKDTGVDCF